MIMMIHTKTKAIDIYQEDVNHDNYSINVEVSKVDEAILISLPNPNHKDLFAENLKDIPIIDKNTKILPLIHFLVGATECSTMKTKTPQKLRQPGAPFPEKSQFE